MEGNTNDEPIMSQFSSILLGHLKQQGFSVLLLIASIYWFSMKNNALEAKVDQCNTMQLQIYEGQIEYLNNIISENTRAINRNTDVMRTIGKGTILVD